MNLRVKSSLRKIRKSIKNHEVIQLNGDEPISYSSSLYNGKDLVDQAVLFESRLPATVTTLVCASSSGMSIASAITALRTLKTNGKISLRIVYVKRSGWTFRYDDNDAKLTHSGILYRERDTELCFVDDLIASGKTFKACLEHVKSKYQKNIKYALAHTGYMTSDTYKQLVEEHKDTQFIHFKP